MSIVLQLLLLPPLLLLPLVTHGGITTVHGHGYSARQVQPAKTVGWFVSGSSQTSGIEDHGDFLLKTFTTIWNQTGVHLGDRIMPVGCQSHPVAACNTLSVGENGTLPMARYQQAAPYNVCVCCLLHGALLSFLLSVLLRQHALRSEF